MARSTITVASFTEVTGPAPTRGRTIRMEQKHENEEQPLVGTDPGWRIPLLLAQPSKLHRDCQDGLRDQCRAFQGVWAVSARWWSTGVCSFSARQFVTCNRATLSSQLKASPVGDLGASLMLLYRLQLSG